MHSSTRDVKIVTRNRPGATGLQGTWNPECSFHGLTARQTSTAKDQGASFWVDGRVSGLPKGGNRDTTEVAGIAVITQRW